MATYKVLGAFYCLLFFIVFACTEEIAPDHSPDPYRVGGIENARLQTYYFSDTITVTGISHPTPAQFDYSTQGEAYVGEIYINDSLAGNHLPFETKVRPGDRVYAKVQSSEFYNTPVTTSVAIGEQSADFTITTQPSPLQSTGYPGLFYYNLKAFIINDKIYLGLGSDGAEQPKIKELYEFDIRENTWVQKAAYSGEVAFSYDFTAGDKFYAGHENGIAEYDPATDSWRSSENGSLGENTTARHIFGVGEDIFALVDYANAASQIWKFAASTLTWNFLSTASLGDNIVWKSLFRIDEEVFALVSYSDSAGKVWKFDPGSSDWIHLSEFNDTAGNRRFLFARQTKAYFRTTDAESFWEYDGVTHTWAARQSLPSPEPALGVSTNETGYVFYHTLDGVVAYEYRSEKDEFVEVAAVYAHGGQNPPDALLRTLSTGERVFFVSAHFSGVLGSADLYEFIVHEPVRR